MGNKKSREFMQQQEVLRAWEAARTEQRHFSENVTLPAIGQRLIQVVYAPSFEPGFAWDVRANFAWDIIVVPASEIESGGDALDAENTDTDFLLNSTWRLFRSSVVSQSDQHLVGYEELDAPSDLLRSYFERLQNLSIPMALPLPCTVGLDGTTYQLALFGEGRTEVRLQWWSESPASWSAVGEVANEMIQKFLTYEPKASPPDGKPSKH